MNSNKANTTMYQGYAPGSEQSDVADELVNSCKVTFVYCVCTRVL